MPWCHKCNIEYRDGFTTCSDCGELLSEEAPNIVNDTPEREIEPVFLTSAGGNLEAELIEAKLKSAGINAIFKYRETGNYMRILTGTSVFGVDIFVGSDVIEQARDLLQTVKVDPIEAVQAEYKEDNQLYDEKTGKPLSYVAVFGFIIAIAALIALIYFMVR